MLAAFLMRLVLHVARVDPRELEDIPALPGFDQLRRLQYTQTISDARKLNLAAQQQQQQQQQADPEDLASVELKVPVEDEDDPEEMAAAAAIEQATVVSGAGTAAKLRRDVLSNGPFAELFE